MERLAAVTARAHPSLEVVAVTATGGTVSASGLFTAAAATGGFSVTATSVQDATKRATATASGTHADHYRQFHQRCDYCVR